MLDGIVLYRAMLRATAPSSSLLYIDLDFDAALGILLIAAVSALILKSFGFRGAPLVAVIASVSLIGSSADTLSGAVGIYEELAAHPDTERYVSAALKAVGISYLSGISADACREIGETGIAKTVSLITRLELIALSLPFIKEILLLSESLLAL